MKDNREKNSSWKAESRDSQGTLKQDPPTGVYHCHGPVILCFFLMFPDGVYFSYGSPVPPMGTSLWVSVVGKNVDR